MGAERAAGAAAPGTGAAGGAVQPLGARERRRRTVAACAVTSVLLAGAAVGTDDWFPLGPFRMYTNRAGSNGIVRVVTLEAVDADGEERRVHGGDVGLRHAELEGQLHRFAEEPELLGAVATAYASVHPDRPPLVRLVLQEEVRRVVDRVVRPEVEEREVATWTATS